MHVCTICADSELNSIQNELAKLYHKEKRDRHAEYEQTKSQRASIWKDNRDRLIRGYHASQVDSN